MNLIIKKFVYNISKKFCLVKVNMIFAKAAGKIMLEFATLMQGGSSFELNAAPDTQNKVFFLFCIIWAASVRRLQSLPNSGIMLLTIKNVTEDVMFTRKVLKTK